MIVVLGNVVVMAHLALTRTEGDGAKGLMAWYYSSSTAITIIMSYESVRTLPQDGMRVVLAQVFLAALTIAFDWKRSRGDDE